MEHRWSQNIHTSPLSMLIQRFRNDIVDLPNIYYRVHIETSFIPEVLWELVCRKPPHRTLGAHLHPQVPNSPFGKDKGVLNLRMTNDLEDILSTWIRFCDNGMSVPNDGSVICVLAGSALIFPLLLPFYDIIWD